MKIELDNWQKEVLEWGGDICVRSGRQVGKSTIISIKGAEYALKNPKTTTLIISAVERQAYLLFEKTLAYLYENHKSKIKKGKDKPTKHKITLVNGSVIWCLPTGLTGYGIRGYTVDLLIADEAAFIPEDVWTAITPMLAVTKGQKILISTPHGKEGYYFERFTDPNFKSWHISSEECERISKEFLERERNSMTKVQYAQEYLGEFVDELRQFFPTEIIKACMTIKNRNFGGMPQSNKYLGVDVAGMGEDETVLAALYRNKDRLKQIDMEVTKHTRLTDTTNRIIISNKKWDFKKIYIDDGGMGVGVFDFLLSHPDTRRKVEAINNSQRSLDIDDEHPRRKRLLKEDLYNNLLHLMERNEVELFDEEEIFLSLKSVQAETDEQGKLKIFGRYTHIAEALIRAAWCMKDKHLNIWARFI